MTVPAAPAAAVPDVVRLPRSGTAVPWCVDAARCGFFCSRRSRGARGARRPRRLGADRREPRARSTAGSSCSSRSTAAAQLAFTLGWWASIGRPHPITFGELFGTYLAGDSVNYFTSVGGEPVKAHLLCPKMGFAKGVRDDLPCTATRTCWPSGSSSSLGAVVALTHFALPSVRAIARDRRAVSSSAASSLGFTGMLRRGVLRADPRPGSGASGRCASDSGISRTTRTPRRADRRVLPPRGAPHALHWAVSLGLRRLVRRPRRDVDRAAAAARPRTGWRLGLAIESLAMVLNNILLFIPAPRRQRRGSSRRRLPRSWA